MKHINFVYTGHKLLMRDGLAYTFKPVYVDQPMDNLPLPPLPGVSLAMYLELMGESYSGFARRVPCHPSYPRMLALGLAKPSYDMAVRIETLTDGMVPRSRWFPPEPAQPKLDIGDI